MSLALLYPLALLGAAAVGVPIWLHLRRKEPSRIVRFSAMQFLDDQPLARQSPLLPRQWPLLLVRILLVLLVTGAFAWPYVRSGRQTAIRESRVYIVDNTMSNQAAQRSVAFRQKVLDALETAAPDVQIAVVELRATPKTLVAFSDDRPTAMRAVANLQPSHQRGSYLGAFRLASRLLEQSRASQRRIVLLGDCQENQWSGETVAAPFLRSVDIELPVVEKTTLANVGLTHPRVTRIRRAAESFIECRVTVVRVGDVADATLSFWANGVQVSRTELSFPEGAASMPARAVWSDASSGWLQGEIRLEGASDALSVDDRAFFSLPPPTRGRVAVLADSRYLRSALAEDIMPQRWKVNDVPSTADGAITLPSEPVDVICMETHYLRLRHVRKWAREALEQGLGLLLVVDAASDLIAGHLDDFGIELHRGDSRRGPPEPFRYIFLDHPVFRPFRSPDFGDLGRVRVGRYRRLTVKDGLPLAYASTGDPLIFSADIKGGRILVLAFGLDRHETNWPLQPTFIPFLDRALGFVRPASEAPETAYRPASSVTWRLPAGRPAGRVILTEADSDGEKTLGSSTIVAGTARLVMPDRPGNYVLQCDGNDALRRRVSVNPAPEESLLKFADSPAILQHWQVEDTDRTFVQEAPAMVTEVSRRDILSQRIWWWLLVAGTMVVLMETLWVSLRRAPA